MPTTTLHIYRDGWTYRQWILSILVKCYKQIKYAENWLSSFEVVTITIFKGSQNFHYVSWLGLTSGGWTLHTW